MRAVTAGMDLLVRCTAAVRAALALGALVRAVVVSAIVFTVVSGVVAALASTGAEPSVVVGVLGTLLVAVAVARNVAVVLPAVTGIGPVVAARDHHRALARRPVPRHRDPDAAGHTRSRAPSELLPAV